MAGGAVKLQHVTIATGAVVGALCVVAHVTAQVGACTALVYVCTKHITNIPTLLDLL